MRVKIEKPKPTIIIDTREQLPYEFSDRVCALRGTLAAGDYSLVGYETEVALERKSLNDYVSTVIGQRERFANELKKLQNYIDKAIVVEADPSHIFEHAYTSNASPASVWGATISIIIDYSIPIYFLGTRPVAVRFVEDFLVRYHRKAARRGADRVPSAEQRERARKAVDQLLPAELRIEK